MALIALTSAKGAPGVTTAALALTLSWPRPALLVEADAAGSSSIISGYFGGQVDHTRIGLVNLAISAGRPDTTAIAAALDAQTLPLSDDGTRHVLPGLFDASQTVTLSPYWAPLARALHTLDATGTDVIIDAGRVGAAGAPAPLLQAADLVLLLTRTDVPSINAAASRAPSLKTSLPRYQLDHDTLQLLVVGEGKPYGAKEIAGVCGIDALASLAFDPAAASALNSARAGRRFPSTRLAKSAVRVAAHIDDQLSETANLLAPTSTEATG